MNIKEGICKDCKDHASSDEEDEDQLSTCCGARIVAYDELIDEVEYRFNMER